jgi:hypothetical protein
MDSARCIKLMSYSFCNPFHGQLTIQPELFQADLSQEGTEELVHAGLKDSFINQYLQDKEVELIFMNTWMPHAALYIDYLEHYMQSAHANILVIMPLENETYVRAWMQESAYCTCDSRSDGVIAKVFSYHEGPVSVLLSSQSG